MQHAAHCTATAWSAFTVFRILQASSTCPACSATHRTHLGLFAKPASPRHCRCVFVQPEFNLRPALMRYWYK
uniref:Putative secreted protein n=1 Tax=Anopheles darlingi TaxID=43151 RepID=A0A2M4DAP6_ANODA